ncbi:MAG: phosphatase PAP2 family protein, partial [Bacteroidales bacterium]
IHTIEGIDLPLRYSFPSGHSATAFALFIGISFLVKSWFLKLILLLIAIIVGFSRVYIAVHFPVDVIAGSLIGVLISFVCFIWVSGWKKEWLDISLGSRIVKKKAK